MPTLTKPMIAICDLSSLYNMSSKKIIGLWSCAFKRTYSKTSFGETTRFICQVYIQDNTVKCILYVRRKSPAADLKPPPPPPPSILFFPVCYVQLVEILKILIFYIEMFNIWGGGVWSIQIIYKVWSWNGGGTGSIVTSTCGPDKNPIYKL